MRVQLWNVSEARLDSGVGGPYVYCDRCGALNAHGVYKRLLKAEARSDARPARYCSVLL